MAIEIDIERERIQWVFSLGGGELHEAHADFPDEWDGLVAYWYGGVPDHVSLGELGLDSDDEVRTAIIDCMFGFAPKNTKHDPESITAPILPVNEAPGTA